MASFWENIFSNEDEETKAVEEDRELFFANKDSVIFLIDCQKPMFEVNEKGEIPFNNAVKCAVATLTDKIISSENDLLGICFYGTRAKQNLNDFDGIFVLMDLDVPDAQKIMDLEAIIKNNDFETTYGHYQGSFPFCDALWTCSTMFSSCSVKVGHKRIFLFTNDDNPNAEDPAVRQRGLQRAADLHELGITIELFSMNKPGTNFDPRLFYQNLISFDEDEDTGVINYDAAEKFEELMARVRKKEFKKRSFGRIPLILGEGTEIAVRLYSILRESEKGKMVWMDSKNNQPVKSMVKWICEDTGTLLLESQIKYWYPYAGERVIFDKEEMQALRSLDKQGIRLLGFKPKSALKIYHNIRHSSFIYPDEQATRGSTAAFAALLDRMIAKDKIAVCRMTTRSNTPPHFVALYPQPEELNEEDGSQITPPGFHVIFLPYSNDIRDLKFDPTVKAEPELIAKAKKIVKTLRINFDSRNFENPALQKHYAALQALALDREQMDEIPDYVNPDLEGMDKFSNMIQDFRDSAFGEGYVPSLKPKAAPKKRKADGDDKDTDGEKKKTVKDAVVLTTEQMVEMLETGEIQKITLPGLKAFLKSQNVKGYSSLRKDELIDKIREVVQGDEGDAADRPKPQVKKPKKAPVKKEKKVDSDEELGDPPPQQPKKDLYPKAVPANDGDPRPMCQYGANCYRTSKQHLEEFKHPK